MKNSGMMIAAGGFFLAVFAVVSNAGASNAGEERRGGSAKTGDAKARAVEWVKVEGNEYVTFYVDHASIRREGNLAKMQTLTDFKTVVRNAGRTYMSTKTQHEYDCAGGQWRLLDFSYHSGSMGEGKVVESDSKPGEWMPVMAGSGTKNRWKIACGKQ